MTTQMLLPLSFGEREIRITLIGCGGTGSALLGDIFQLSGILKALGGAGIHVTAIDGDEVSQSNVFRQSFWQHDIGLNKAEVLISRFNTFGGLNWSFKPHYVDETTSLGNTDIIVTCVDKASVRTLIAKRIEASYFRNSDEVYWLDLGNDNHTAQVYFGKAKSGLDIPSPADLFGSQWLEIAKTEHEVPSCSTEQAIAKQTYGINSMCAKSASSMLLFPFFRQGKLDHNGLFIDLHAATTTRMNVNPIEWGFYGWEPKTA
ncbi:PRTRC system ThiF family protein [Photobacterium damselae subsp. damselae]|uniref:PRTRC system ThiF family protein n=1 Tax=Photobacterium damselae subsp. damselae TaxID=85581 RepID=A0AAD3WZI0_PHODD|nr:PRTRC system ThiF family protein [Photobacterium damselae]KAB1185706.1 PRTRC system ThiF family protein [Photobacterium damselae subsp. damselae]NVO61477.1 PRTRC system ThiF family protein [Photobacterium damselae subsp. damselae]PSB85299.1 PRTRC system ThiF family protein [Photobacterium damselae subsp. damselae]